MANTIWKTDQDLLAGIAARDVQAFAAFYDRHCDRVYGLLRCILRDSLEAEDVLQEVFWQVWSQPRQYDATRAAPIAWLLVKARSRARDRRRRLTRAPRARELSFDSVDGGMQHDAVDEREAAEQVVAALERLPIEQREPICRAFFDGMTHSEISDVLNLPLGTVKTRIRQGMMKLRDAVLPAKVDET